MSPALWIGDQLQIVGDDLDVTNTKFIARGSWELLLFPSCRDPNTSRHAVDMLNSDALGSVAPAAPPASCHTPYTCLA